MDRNDDYDKNDNDQFVTNNSGFNTASVIQIRLDTTGMLDQLEAFFKGSRLIGYEENNGLMKPVYGKSGVQRVNDNGVQSIMSWLTPIFSPHTVQGNFDTTRYDDFICELEIDFRNFVMTNLYDWEIKLEDYDGIVDMVMKTALAYFSRLIDNKERESYSNTFKSVESSVYDKKSNGLLGMFRSG